MRNYLAYVLAVVLAFVVWALIFRIMSKSKGNSKDIKGILLAGPAHFILRRRGYKLNKREILGWGVVFLVMLMAPLISNWLEK